MNLCLSLNLGKSVHIPLTFRDWFSLMMLDINPLWTHEGLSRFRAHIKWRLPLLILDIQYRIIQV